jgi:hypothetical protein
VRIVTPELPKSEQVHIRAFYPVQASDTETAFSGRGYLCVTTIHEKADYRQQVLNRAHGELTAWKQRYTDLRDYFSGVFHAIEEIKPKSKRKK